MAGETYQAYDGTGTRVDPAEVLRRAAKATTWCYDVETSGLDVRRCHVIGYVLGFGPTPKDSFYLPVRHAGGGNIPHPSCPIPDSPTGWDGSLHPIEQDLALLATNPNLHIFGHNLKFDLHMSIRHGIHFEGTCEDTMVNAALINEHQGRFNLDATAKAMRVTAKKGDAVYARMAKEFGGEPVVGQMSNFWRTSAAWAEVADYVTGDGVTTWQVWEAQRIAIDDEELTQVWEVEKRVTKVLWKMEHRGVKIDVPGLEKYKTRLEGMIETSSRKFPADFNARSPKSVADFFRSHGFKDSDFARTPTGKFSFTEPWLQTNDLGRMILNTRKYENLLSSFISPILERHLHGEFIHPSYNQSKQDEFGTVSGRLSSSDPNAQQVPRRNKELGREFRKVWLPDDPEFIWSSNDMSQAEFRLFTHYTGSPVLIRNYNATPPVDIHSWAAEALNIERDPAAKRLNLAVVYGAGVAKIALMLDISATEAKRIRAMYDDQLPEAKTFMKKAETRARNRGYVMTPLGRRARFPDVRLSHKAANRIIQGANADYVKVKLCEIDDYFASEGYEERLLLTVHDSIDWQYRPGREKQNEEALRIFADAGKESRIPLTVPMKVDHKSGRNWSEATYGA